MQTINSLPAMLALRAAPSPAKGALATTCWAGAPYKRTYNVAGLSDLSTACDHARTSWAFSMFVANTPVLRAPEATLVLDWTTSVGKHTLTLFVDPSYCGTHLLSYTCFDEDDDGIWDAGNIWGFRVHIPGVQA